MIKTITKLSILSAFVAFTMPALAQDAPIPEQKLNPEIRAILPEAIKERGYLVAVNSGSYPPYQIVTSPTELEGASSELATAIGQIFGLDVRHQTVSGLAPMLAGFDAGRFDLSIGPTGDFPDRRTKIDFIDWVQEYVAFAVQKDNPKNIQSLDDVCGLDIAVMAAGSAERVLKQKAEECAAQNKPMTVQSFPDQSSSILSVRSKRSDGFFSGQAPLTYFVAQAANDLELAAPNLPNGFGDIYQGTITPKNSPLGQAVLAAFNELNDNGTYAMIMKKWGLERNMLAKPGINLAK